MVARVLSGVVIAIGLTATSAGAQNEVDEFMERVLAQRDENRITLQDYVLDEQETFELVGPGRVVLQSFRREYTWYVRDGYLIRSPVRVDGVEIDETRRLEAEEEWLRQEERRSVRRQRQKRPLSRRTVHDDVTTTIERLWGDDIDGELAEDIAEDARLWDDDMAAIVASADRILEDLDGVAAVGFGRTVERLRDGFVMLEEERLEALEVGGLLDAVAPELIGALGEADEPEVGQLVELLELAVARGLSAPAAVDALTDAVSTATAAGQLARAQTLDRLRDALADAATVAETDAGRVGEVAAQASLQPRFVSESYFMDFEFEPGNYYLVGREELAGREVLRIEYYPQQMFSDERVQREETDRDEREDEIEAGFDKTSLVTLWIDQTEHQIVKFTFDNVGFEFLPARWLVRLDDLKASMVMGQPIADVWLPERVELNGTLTMANGSFNVVYARTFTDYRQADTGARIRGYEPTRD